MINDKDKLKELRIEMGLSHNDLATLLGLSDDRTIRSWEEGKEPIPGPAGVALEYIAQGFLDKTEKAVFPEFIISESKCYNDKLSYELIVRLWYPRFIGFLSDENFADNLDSSVPKIHVAGNEYLIVPLLIDPVLNHQQIDEVLNRTRDYISTYTIESFPYLEVNDVSKVTH